MAIDREATLKKAEKLLRQGRLDAAIAEYARVVEDQPRDWATINALGDLHVRAGQVEKAAAQYLRIAEHFVREGFLSKAAALFKKILKIRPDDEQVQLQLAEISARQGLLADAKAHFTAIERRRQARGDHRGAQEILLRVGSLDPADFEARLAAARILAEGGDGSTAAEWYRKIAADLQDRDRIVEARQALEEVVRLDPGDIESRKSLIRVLLAMGETEAASACLTRATAGDDPTLLAIFLEIEWRAGRIAGTKDVLQRVLQVEPARREQLTEIGWSFCESQPETAFACADALAEAAVAAGDWAVAAAALHEFVNRVPNQIPALLKLVEICVDGGLEATMYLAQAQLADAYLAAGQAAEARVIAEDLVAREPWERAHIERFRQALIRLGESNADAVIAERLSGDSPFTGKDHFSDLDEAEPADLANGGQRQSGHDGRPAGAAAPAQAAAEAGPGTEIDLTGDLTGLAPEATAPRRAKGRADSPPTGFQEFHDEVARESRAESAAQQYKLALTYREMGMAAEAIKALHAAVRSPRHRFEAAALLADLYRERGEIPQAIEWMERAAQAPAPTAEAGRALLYRLAETLEGVGESARALAVFLELQADTDGYRDVAARINRLSRVQAGG